jgi:hypothetical protein
LSSLIGRGAKERSHFREPIAYSKSEARESSFSSLQIMHENVVIVNYLGRKKDNLINNRGSE